MIDHHRSRLKIPPPISGGLILSYKCTATCRHCMYACSPQWPADWISFSELQTCLQRLAGYIRPAYGGRKAIGLNQGLHFTGGEPFMNYSLLINAVETAADMGIPSLFVETNCAWCTSEGETRDKLRLLKEKGLCGILISVNPYYTEFVPFEQTERCVRLSLEIFGTNVMIYQMEFFQLFLKSGVKGCLSFREFQNEYAQYLNPWNVELFLMGRATQALRSFYLSKPASHFYAGGCRPPVLREWHNHFDNYGNFMPGFCGGISLGDWHDLEQIIKQGIDLCTRPVLAFLVQENLQGLHEFAREHGYGERQERYISRCDLCLDLRCFLVKQKPFPELQPIEFYQQLEKETGRE